MATRLNCRWTYQRTQVDVFVERHAQPLCHAPIRETCFEFHRRKAWRHELGETWDLIPRPTKRAEPLPMEITPTPRDRDGDVQISPRRSPDASSYSEFVSSVPTVTFWYGCFNGELCQTAIRDSIQHRARRLERPHIALVQIIGEQVSITSTVSVLATPPLPSSIQA